MFAPTLTLRAKKYKLR